MEFGVTTGNWSPTKIVALFPLNVRTFGRANNFPSPLVINAFIFAVTPKLYSRPLFPITEKTGKDVVALAVPVSVTTDFSDVVHVEGFDRVSEPDPVVDVDVVVVLGDVDAPKSAQLHETPRSEDAFLDNAKTCASRSTCW